MTSIDPANCPHPRDEEVKTSMTVGKEVRTQVTCDVCKAYLRGSTRPKTEED